MIPLQTIKPPGLCDTKKQYHQWDPYICRANELEAGAPHIAFFIRKYVVERLNTFKEDFQTEPEMETLFLEQLNAAEKLSQFVDKDKGRQIYRDFCFCVFKKAYDEELENAANWFHFYVAALLLDTLKQFGPLDSFAKKRRDYAKMKAVDLSKKLGNCSPKFSKELEQDNNQSIHNTSPIVSSPKELVTDTLVDSTLAQDYLTKGIDEETLQSINNAKESVKNSLAALSFYDVNDAIQHLSQALHYLKEKQ
ncbi:uncharacterized protein LOC128884130 isoform X1 [Hylaeus volcanicus]|uniref:uncharacterized protein LOC128884130 isoform X1 n=1 Tax=Hylaeus volcanicus TaxID=313075 RepID=UPI0023B7EF92|nr:uncharacterized protein LOC128884130 isoform X1 [Hylaeus volcanicus]